jgi:asparagine synthase (glutamine-hydrolysing)
MTWVMLGPRGIAGTRQHEVAHDDTHDAGPTLTAGWRIDGDRLEVYGDRLGLIPLFCYRDASCIVAADEIAEVVARVPHPRFDDAAVSVFLQLGFYVGEDTPFGGVKVLAPGERLVWEGCRAEVNAPALPIAEPFAGGWDDALPRYVELFEHAVARRARLGVGRLTVSGGRDSRHLFLELLRQRRPPPAVITQDRPVNTDLAIGRRLASRAGVPHIAVEPFRDGLAEELQKNRWNHYLTDENSWYLQIVPHLEGPLFDGLAGGMLSGTDMFQADRLSAAIGKDTGTAAARALLSVMGSALRFLREPFLARWSRDLATERLAVELERHRHAPNPITSFLFWNRTRREIALIPLCIAARHVPVRLAYLDPPLMAFLSSLPHPAFSGTGFHSHVMARTYPAFADMPYGEKRRRPRSLRRAMEESAAALRFGFAPAISRRACLRSVLEAVLRAQPVRVSGWLYRVLPLVQAARDLGVDSGPQAGAQHRYFPSPQNGLAEE